MPIDAVVGAGFERAPERVTVRPVDSAEVQRLAAELSISDVVAGLLLARGLRTYEQCERYFNPRLEDLHDPFLFRDMAQAVDRVGAAIGEGEKIVVYGDYDVDGVTATAMMVGLLRRLGADCEYYLPNRLTEGYGISEEAVRTIAGTGAALIITVDCGVTAAHEVGVARSLGMDVIVSDHHEPRGHVPDNCPVLNPKLPGERYPEQVLAGVGVALKLCQALCVRLLGGGELWKEYLDLVALGTAADIVPLTGENRIIVSAGLQRLQASENTGLRALIREQGLEATVLHTHHVVFQIAPCINAVGRLGDSRRAVELLLTTDSAVASLYARELAQSNRERRALNERVEEDAVGWVLRHCDPSREAAIVAGHEDWHKGVIGIVASKLVERFYRPSILFSIEDGIAHGSGRTVPQLHLLDALSACDDLLQSYGGHAAAAGVTLKAS
ncbi:MAG: single-stranded-DNA-specific exonuclease RecJ, partial [Chitinivibrionales bacterium]|nr:single-stranded-DNA-specific exonuclease RecJ [Chitinivibrionales bacterium]